MPRRWLSIRTHKDEDGRTPTIPEGFDFAFGIKSGSTASTPTTLGPKEPVVFYDDARRARAKPDLTLQTGRPQSARNSSRFSGSYSASRATNSCIGMAFGSPINPPQPPQTFEAMGLGMSASRQHFAEDPSPQRTSSFKKWRKIGGFFRSRSNSEKNLPLVPQEQLEKSSHKPGTNTYRTRWPNPTSSPAIQDGFISRNPSTRDLPLKERPKTSHGPHTTGTQNFTECGPVPSIQVKIPGSSFERYSIMFKNLNATPQLGKNRRRSCVVETATQEPSPIQEDTVGVGLKRRVTSPTVIKASDTPETTSKPATSGYSLFPSTPSSSRPPSRQRPSNLSYSRPWTAPGQPQPPETDRCSQQKQQVTTPPPVMKTKTIDLQKQVPCPVTPANAETRNITPQSRVSSNGEIFFDVKSLHDSKGLNVTQYEMTTPPSTELQLARSMSNARRRIQRPSRSLSSLKTIDAPVTRSTYGETDDTSALVKSLTHASAPMSATTRDREVLSPKKMTSQHGQVSSIQCDESSNHITARKRKAVPSKSEGLSIGIPPSGLEAIEETSPRTIHSRHSIALMSEGTAIAGQDLVRPRTRANSNDTRTSKPQLNKDLPLLHRPVVPMKDSNFIPLSKYAPIQTAEDLVRQTATQPSQALRAGTDDTASYNGGTTVFRRQFPPGKSRTMPYLDEPNPIESQMKASLSSRRHMASRSEQDLPMVVAYVRPPTEVSVARTISLSRKSSATITVSKQSSRNGLRAGNRSTETLVGMRSTEKLSAFVEANSPCRMGPGQHALLDGDVGIPSSPMSLPSTSDFTRTLDVFPTPPMITT